MDPSTSREKRKVSPDSGVCVKRLREGRSKHEENGMFGCSTTCAFTVKLNRIPARNRLTIPSESDASERTLSSADACGLKRHVRRETGLTPIDVPGGAMRTHRRWMHLWNGTSQNISKIIKTLSIVRK